MGLDTYAVYGKGHHKYNDDPQASNLVPDELFPKNNLCGGLFSGGGNSFRGKVYNDWVEYCTGVSLYEEEIPADVVEQMYKALSKQTNPVIFGEFNNSGCNDTYQIDFEQAQDILEWFKVVNDEGASIVGWW
jgi:hypothetical protein